MWRRTAHGVFTTLPCVSVYYGVHSWRHRNLATAVRPSWPFHDGIQSWLHVFVDMVPGLRRTHTDRCVAASSRDARLLVRAHSPHFSLCAADPSARVASINAPHSGKRPLPCEEVELPPEKSVRLAACNLLVSRVERARANMLASNPSATDLPDPRRVRACEGYSTIFEYVCKCSVVLAVESTKAVTRHFATAGHRTGLANASITSLILGRGPARQQSLSPTPSTAPPFPAYSHGAVAVASTVMVAPVTDSITSVTVPASAAHDVSPAAQIVGPLSARSSSVEVLHPPLCDMTDTGIACTASNTVSMTMTGDSVLVLAEVAEPSPASRIGAIPRALSHGQGQLLSRGIPTRELQC